MVRRRRRRAGGTIAAVGALADHPARRTIDASGLFVAPGFIDLLGQSEYNVLVDPRAASKITQGITTEVTGEGDSIAPSNERMLAEGEDFFEHYGVRPDFRTLADTSDVREARAAINLGTFVGAGTLRDYVIGSENRRATPAELARMADLVDQAMREGALGVSSSLQYVPDIYNSTEEIVALAKVAARYGGAYFTHQRSEANRSTLARRGLPRRAGGGDPTQIWHLKTAYKPNWGKMPAVLARIEEARRAASTSRPTSTRGPRLQRPRRLPAAVDAGGRPGRPLKRLADPTLRERAKTDMDEDTGDWDNQYLGSGGPTASSSPPSSTRS